MSAPTRLVLDTDAMLAYARGLPGVGGELAAASARGQVVLVPATCLALAYQRVPNAGWDCLDVLSRLPQAVVVPLVHEDCSVLGGWARTLGLDVAHAAIEAAAHPITPLMTSQREFVTRFLPKEWPIIDV